MTDNIDVVVKESGSSQVVTSFDNVAAAAQRAHTSVSALQKTLGSVGRSTAAANRVTALGAAAQGATSHVNNLNSAMTTLNNTRVTSNLNSANQALGNTSTQANNAANGMRNLVAAFLSFQAIKNVVGSLIEAQVSMQQIHYGLLAATGSAKGANEQFEFLERTADKLGTNLKSSAQEYTRLAASAEAMNVAVEDQQKLYTALSQASTVLHLDQQKMQFATLALTQMFSKGKIQAEELRRQLGEAIPGANVRFQKAVMEIVKGTDLARYSFEDLMKRGLLNTKQFLPQLIQALEETGRGWEEASKGLNAEINRLQNSWFKLKVELSEGLFSEVTIRIVRFLSSNLKSLTGVIAGLGVAIAIAFSPTPIMAFAAQVQKLWLLLMANPFFAIAAAIAGVITYLGFMRDEIKLGVDDTTTLGDMMRSAWENLVPVVQSVGKWINETLGGIGTAIAGTFNEIINRANDYEHENEAMWLRILRVVVRVFDMIGGTIRGVFMGVNAVIGTFIAAWVNNFEQLGNAVRAILSGDVGGVKDAVVSNLKGYKDAALNAADIFSSAFQTEVLRQSDSGLESVLDAWIKDAQRISALRTAKPPGAPDAPGGGGGGGGGGDAGKANKEMERLMEALRRVIGEINPTQEALRKLAEAQEILNKVMAKGTPEMKAMVAAMGGVDVIMGRLRDKYKEQLDPVGYLVDKYREEREILSYVGDEQQVQAELLGKVRDLKKKNYEVTDQHVEALKREIEATQQLKRENEALNNVLNQTVYARRAEIDQINAIAAARKMNIDSGGKSGITQGQQSQMAVQIFGEDAMQGTQEYFDMISQGYIDMMAKIDAARQANIISEQTAQKLTTDAYLTQLNQRLNVAGNFFGQLSQLQNSENKKMARIGKAAAIAQAMIATYTGATEAYKSMAGIPYIGPALGIAAATAAIAAGLANVQAIRSQGTGFRTGGSFTVGGSGGPDSQLVQFNATPGEQVQVNTPGQARALEDGDRAVEVNAPMSVAIVADRESAHRQIRRDPAMKQWIVEVIQENNGPIAKVLGVR